MTKNEITNFYNNYYKHEAQINPAYIIYDQLRIKAILNLLPKKSINLLVIGCGSRNDKLFFQESDKSFAFDLSLNAIKRIRSDSDATDIFFITADAVKIPFPDNFFDIIVCSEVLEHIPEINNALFEIRRVSKNNSNIIISTPNWLSLFGMFRYLSELILNKRMSSDDQPYDDWKTIFKLKRELSPYFLIENSIGVWYFPPFHFRGRGLSKTTTNNIYNLLSPIEKFFSRFIPHFGHLIIIKCKPIK